MKLRFNATNVHNKKLLDSSEFLALVSSENKQLRAELDLLQRELAQLAVSHLDRIRFIEKFLSQKKLSLWQRIKKFLGFKNVN